MRLGEACVYGSLLFGGRETRSRSHDNGAQIQSLHSHTHTLSLIDYYAPPGPLPCILKNDKKEQAFLR